MNFSAPEKVMREIESEQLSDMQRRLVRIETRLTKLLLHFGLDVEGNPVTSNPRKA